MIKLITDLFKQKWAVSKDTLWSSVKNLPDNAGNMSSIPGPVRSHAPQSN